MYDHTHFAALDVKYKRVFELYPVCCQIKFCFYCQAQLGTLTFVFCPKGIIRPQPLQGFKDL